MTEVEKSILQQWSQEVLQKFYHVEQEQIRLADCMEKVDKKMDEMSGRITLLQIKTASLCAGASLIVTIITILISNAMKG